MRRLLPPLFVLSSLLLTWPLARDLSSQIPLGSEPAEAVPFLNVWTVGWNGQRLLRGYEGYWDAPIFYPVRGAFAFSDPQPLTALGGALFWEGSPALAYNLILLGYLTLNGSVTYAVLRQRGTPFGPAVLGGLIVQALPIATNERGVLQLQPLFGPIWAIAAMWSLLRRPSAPAGLSLGLALGVTFLTSEYYALLLVPTLTIEILLLRSRLRRPTTWRSLAVAVGLAAILTLPIALPQAAHLRALGFQRSQASFARTSAWPADYLRPSTRVRVGRLIPELEFPANQRLYPGAMLAGLAGLGAVASLRQGGSSRRWVGFLSACVLAGFGLSLGSHLRIAGAQPLTLLHQSMPVLGFTRSAFRFAVLVQIALALLASQGVTWLWSRSRPLAATLAALALLEISPLPERLVEVPDTDPAWVAVLASADQPVVAHLPWADGRSASQFARTTRWMIQSLPHGLQLVNGYSGFFPAQHAELRGLMGDYPTELATKRLRALGADFVVLHGPIDPEQRLRIDRMVEEGEILEIGSTVEAAVLRLADPRWGD